MSPESPSEHASTLVARVDEALADAGLQGLRSGHPIRLRSDGSSNVENNLVVVDWWEGPSEARVEVALAHLEPESWMLQHGIGARLRSAIVLTAGDRHEKIRRETRELLKRGAQDLEPSDSRELEARTRTLVADAIALVARKSPDGKERESHQRLDENDADPLRLAQAVLALELTDTGLVAPAVGIRTRPRRRSEARIRAALAEILSDESATRAALATREPSGPGTERRTLEG